MKYAILLAILFLGSQVFISPKTTRLAPLRSGKDFALFFAVNDYTNWSDLKGPVQDAKNIAAELQAKIKTLLEPKTRLLLTSGGKERTPDPSDFAARFLQGLQSNRRKETCTPRLLYYTCCFMP